MAWLPGNCNLVETRLREPPAVLLMDQLNELTALCYSFELGRIKLGVGAGFLYAMEYGGPQTLCQPTLPPPH